LLDFAALLKIAEAGLASGLEEIERFWTFEMMQKALAYIEMESTIDYYVNKALQNKDK
jgi:hypothetical protein